MEETERNQNLPTRQEINKLWEIIKSSGCSDIQKAINGLSPDDFDPEMLRWMADFVKTSPPDTQASPKK